jgi:hypothetical protein
MYRPPPPGPPNSSAPVPVLGIISLITGILSLFPGCCCGMLGTPIALVAIGTGVATMFVPDQASGKPMGIAGIACGAISLLFIIVLLILQIMGAVAPNVFDAMQQMQQNP